MFRIVLGFLIALPVGALDGVIAYALKPYMDEVLIKKNMLLACIIPFGIVAFAALQGVLRYPHKLDRPKSYKRCKTWII